MQEFYVVLAVTLLAVVSPGADFAMVSRNSYVYGRMAGVSTAVGIAVAIWLHVAYAVLGVGLLLQNTPMLMQVVQTVGALYLAYIAWQTWRQPPLLPDSDTDNSHSKSTWAAFKNGLVSNALNPKTTLFVLSVYSQVVRANSALWQLLVYGGLMSLAHLLWFAWVAVALSQARVRRCLLSKQRVVNRVIASVLLLLAGVLLCA